ncbi:TIM-barrel domain-containing protein [Murimonas intestini]|uniref:glycoside hydrolase family 31 protein n=1 Tax=Murimonas intestini TaxID=1337051 RepID=UPI001FAA41B5|nr:TIM-barrel domain-containing protein [Murimonas intestini]
MKRIKLCQTPDYSDHNTGSSADQRMECSPDRFLTELPGRETAAVSWNQEGEQIHLEISLPYEGVYGLGERFNGLNQKGKDLVIKVEEKFCYQGEKTYCPMPFFFTDTGFGFYADTSCVTEFEFKEKIRCVLPAGIEIVIFTGTPASVISEYMELCGRAVLPPDYAFGPWISANHWNSEADVYTQIENLEKFVFPASVLVMEAWSDEATFYLFNGASCTGGDKERLAVSDLDFSKSSRFRDPAEMIRKLHEKGLHLVLWQIPVYKKQGGDEEVSVQNEKDRQEALENRLCVMNPDNTPYEIPEGHWFAGSWVPDFTNPRTRSSWFGKRQYLLDMGVDGFKTDGGEFIYRDDVVFADGSAGREGINRYAADYLRAYTEFIGSGRVLFSRAGYTGMHTVPMHWAGDHQSDNEEFVSTLHAGLSASVSGIIFWGFDIGGFAGSLPSLDLYRRATQMACFCPVMQWHSEPDGGQFRELMAGGSGNNERSPWNMAEAYGCPGFIEEMRYWHWLRINLLPYICSSARKCVRENMPFMRPLVYGWPQDREAAANEDEYCFGDGLLVAPLMEEDSTQRQVYLPEGGWYNFFTKERTEGGRSVMTTGGGPGVFVREHQGIALQTEQGKKLGEPVKHREAADWKLHLILAGRSGEYTYLSDREPVSITWDYPDVSVAGGHIDGLSWEIWV